MSHSPPGPFFFGSDYLWRRGGRGGGDDGDKQNKKNDDGHDGTDDEYEEEKLNPESEDDSDFEVSPHARAKFGSPEEKHF